MPGKAITPKPGQTNLFSFFKKAQSSPPTVSPSSNSKQSSATVSSTRDEIDKNDVVSSQTSISNAVKRKAPSIGEVSDNKVKKEEATSKKPRNKNTIVSDEEEWNDDEDNDQSEEESGEESEAFIADSEVSFLYSTQV